MRIDIRHWEIVIAIAIAISYQSFEAAFAGAISISAAIVRFVTAGALSWAAVALWERLWDAYSRAARQRQLEEYLRHRAETGRSMSSKTPNFPMQDPNH